MWPIGFCSIAALALFFERYRSTGRVVVVPPGLQTNVEGLLARGLPGKALELCRSNASVLARVLVSGIRLAGQGEGTPVVSRVEVKDALEAAGRREAEELRRFVGAIATIATIAPLLGLLGTVWGMVETFQVIEVSETVSKTTMAGGIWKALLTTVAGLIVAIPTVLAHRMISSRITDRVTELEAGAERVAELLLHPELSSSFTDERNEA